MKTPKSHPPRAFTLIELMISVAIVGIMSSIALPEYSRVLARARSSERATVMDGIARALYEVVSVKQSVPNNSWVGVDNPSGTPTWARRHFNNAASGWTALSLVVEGETYYTYGFHANDPGGDGHALTATITGEGDLDGDGNRSLRVDEFAGTGYLLEPDLANSIPADPAIL